jgi:hypothetical protein
MTVKKPQAPSASIPNTDDDPASRRCTFALLAGAERAASISA